jgi:hypothetical protein
MNPGPVVGICSERLLYVSIADIICQEKVDG